MTSTSWLIPLLLAWPFFRAIRILLVSRNVMGLKLGLRTIEVIPAENVPAHYIEWVRPYFELLESMGFSAGACVLDSGLAGTLTVTYFEAYSNTDPITARISRDTYSAVSTDARIAFYSTLENGDELVSTSVKDDRVVKRPAKMRHEALEGGSPDEVLAFHRQRLAQLAEGGLKAVRLDPEPAMERRRLIASEETDAAIASGKVSKRPDGTYSYKLVPSILYANKLINSVKKRGKESLRKQRAHPVPPLSPASVEGFEMEIYRKLDVVRKGQVMMLPKALLMAGSLVVFMLALGWQVSAEGAALILAVLVFHEGGHLLGMKIFGFRDTQLLFIPFLGGAAVGFDKERVKPSQYLIILFLGPLPGLFIGIALSVSGYADSGWLHELAGMLVFLNAFNLLPFLPLDGGQIVDTAFLVRFPYAKVVFTALSGAGLIALAIYLPGASLLLVIGGLMLYQVRAQWRVASLMREVRAEVSTEGSEEDLARRLFRFFRERKKWNLSLNAAAIKAKAMMANLRRPMPTIGALVFGVVGYTSPFWLGMPLYHFASQLRFEKKLAETRSQAAAAGVLLEFPAYHHVGVPDDENAAVSLREETGASPDDGVAGFNDEAMKKMRAHLDEGLDPKGLALLREAAGRRSFDPDPAWLDDRAAFVRLVADLRFMSEKAQERAKLNDLNGALLLVDDELKIDRLLQQIPSYWDFSSHDYVIATARELIQETTADGPGVSPEVLAKLADDLPLRANLEYGRDSQLQQELKQQHMLARYGRGEGRSSSYRVLDELLGWMSNTSGQEIERLRRQIRLKREFDQAVLGRWPNLDQKQEDLARSGDYMLFEVADEQAKISIARTALAICWQLRTTGHMPSGFQDIHVPWWEGVPRSPFDGAPLDWKQVDGVGVLSFHGQPGDAGDNGESSAELSWTLPLK